MTITLWQPFSTAPRDGDDFLAARVGHLIWERPDEAGFLSGCDLGPDVFEADYPQKVIVVSWCEDRFIDDMGNDFVPCGIERRMYDPDFLDGPDDDGRRPLRLTDWMRMPDPPQDLTSAGKNKAA